MSKSKISSEALEILSRLDELSFLSARGGVYVELHARMGARLEDGESVSGPWVLETLKSIQVGMGLVPL